MTETFPYLMGKPGNRCLAVGTSHCGGNSRLCAEIATCKKGETMTRVIDTDYRNLVGLWRQACPGRSEDCRGATREGISDKIPTIRLGAG
jgi:hypothetical protein